ncbi:hypothetical protein BH11PAT2_BH11PAT2_01160 [soil metagenome]
MALIQCSECGHNVSDKALVCPHCGNPLSVLETAVTMVPEEPAAFSEPTKIPKSVGFYYLVRVVLFTALITFPAVVFHAWTAFFVMLFIVIDIPLWIFFSMEVANKTFQLSENQITVSGGILSKYSIAIAFSNAQNVITTSGPILRLFGLERLSAWTSSPSQIVIREGNSDNRPDMSLVLHKADAEYVRVYMLKK